MDNLEKLAAKSLAKMSKQADIHDAVLMMKTANVPAEQALRTIYPDWDAAEIRYAAMTIRTMDKTAAVMQVSSAMAELDKTASAEKKKITFSPAMDKSPLLKGKQSKLPDQIQAKILKGKMKKEQPIKDKMASAVSLIGLQYASNAMYASHLQKTAGIGDGLMRMIGAPSVAGWAAKGSGIGGAAGGISEGLRLKNLLSTGGQAKFTKGMADYGTAQAAATKAGKEIQIMRPGQAADASKGQVAYGFGSASQNASNKAMIDKFTALGGAEGFKANPQEYLKLLAPSVLKNMGAGAAAGGALGASAAGVGRQIAKRKAIDTAKRVAVPAALGAGGYALLSS